jgi:hypothetical protein
MDDITEMLEETKITTTLSISQLVNTMTVEAKHWILWEADDAPLCTKLEKIKSGDEIVIELYWKNGLAADIIDILSHELTGTNWWSRHRRHQIIIGDDTVGEILMLFS